MDHITHGFIHEALVLKVISISKSFQEQLSDHAIDLT